MAAFEPVTFHPDSGAFVLRTQSTVHVMRVNGERQLVHVGCGPLRDDEPLPALALDGYEDPTYVWEQQARRFELPTFGDVSYHAVGLKVTLPGEGGTAVRDLRLRYESHDVTTDARPGFAPAHLQPRDTSPRQTLRVRVKDVGYDLFATLCYRVTPEHDVVERWVELENHTPHRVEVERLMFGCVHLPHGRYELLHAAGGWAREFVTVTRALEQGQVLLNQQGLNTGHACNPAFLLHARRAVDEEHGRVYFGALAYSGNWELRFEVLSTGAVRVFGGYESSDFALPLEPGQRHATPAFVHGLCEDGLGGASRRMHRFVRDRVLPQFESRTPRPVLYNNWEATYFEFNHDLLVDVARRAARIGCELFCLDDGWFGGRRHDRAGLGDWVVSTDVLPHGLRPLADEVHLLGMKFGLWFEPEMVNPDSDLYRAHPDWVLHYPDRPRVEQRHQLVLDLGRPEVCAYLLARIDEVVTHNRVDFIKWDFNRYASEPGSVAGQAIWHTHIARLYELIDTLRQRHPRLSIQSCSGGGGRIDLGILARTDQVWTSDNTDAYDRVAIQDGFSLTYPSCVMESWVTHEKNHQTGRTASVDLRLDVAMRGVLGIGPALSRMSEEELDLFARKIAFYKSLRPVLHEGDLYRLATTRTGGVSIWQWALPDASAAVYSFVCVDTLQGVHTAPPRLRGLDAGAVYTISDEHGRELARVGGAQLMSLGLPTAPTHGSLLRPWTSRTLLLRRG